MLIPLTVSAWRWAKSRKGYDRKGRRTNEIQKCGIKLTDPRFQTWGETSEIFGLPSGVTQDNQSNTHPDKHSKPTSDI